MLTIRKGIGTVKILSFLLISFDRVDGFLKFQHHWSAFFLLIADANNKEGHRHSENSFLLISFERVDRFLKFQHPYKTKGSLISLTLSTALSIWMLVLFLFSIKINISFSLIIHIIKQGLIDFISVQHIWFSVMYLVVIPLLLC